MASATKNYPVKFVWDHGGSEVFLSIKNPQGDNRTMAVPFHHYGHHEVTLMLPVGRFEYRYLVDGDWSYDEDLPALKIERTKYNNMIKVKVPTLNEVQWNKTPRPENLQRAKTKVKKQKTRKYKKPTDEVTWSGCRTPFEDTSCRDEFMSEQLLTANIQASTSEKESPQVKVASEEKVDKVLSCSETIMSDDVTDNNTDNLPDLEEAFSRETGKKLDKHSVFLTELDPTSIGTDPELMSQATDIEDTLEDPEEDIDIILEPKSAQCSNPGVNRFEFANLFSSNFCENLVQEAVKVAATKRNEIRPQIQILIEEILEDEEQEFNDSIFKTKRSDSFVKATEELTDMLTSDLMGNIQRTPISKELLVQTICDHKESHGTTITGSVKADQLANHLAKMRKSQKSEKSTTQNNNEMSQELTQSPETTDKDGTDAQDGINEGQNAKRGDNSSTTMSVKVTNLDQVEIMKEAEDAIVEHQQQQFSSKVKNPKIIYKHNIIYMDQVRVFPETPTSSNETKTPNEDTSTVAKDSSKASSEVGKNIKQDSPANNIKKETKSALENGHACELKKTIQKSEINSMSIEKDNIEATKPSSITNDNDASSSEMTTVQNRPPPTIVIDEVPQDEVNLDFSNEEDLVPYNNEVVAKIKIATGISTNSNDNHVDIPHEPKQNSPPSNEDSATKSDVPNVKDTSSETKEQVPQANENESQNKEEIGTSENTLPKSEIQIQSSSFEADSSQEQTKSAQISYLPENQSKETKSEGNPTDEKQETENNSYVTNETKDRGNNAGVPKDSMDHSKIQEEKSTSQELSSDDWEDLGVEIVLDGKQPNLTSSEDERVPVEEPLCQEMFIAPLYGSKKKPQEPFPGLNMPVEEPICDVMEVALCYETGNNSTESLKELIDQYHESGMTEAELQTSNSQSTVVNGDLGGKDYDADEEVDGQFDFDSDDDEDDDDDSDFDHWPNVSAKRGKDIFADVRNELNAIQKSRSQSDMYIQNELQKSASKSKFLEGIKQKKGDKSEIRESSKSTLKRKKKERQERSRGTHQTSGFKPKRSRSAGDRSSKVFKGKSATSPLPNIDNPLPSTHRRVNPYEDMPKKLDEVFGQIRAEKVEAIVPVPQPEERVAVYFETGDYSVSGMNEAVKLKPTDLKTKIISSKSRPKGEQKRRESKPISQDQVLEPPVADLIHIEDPKEEQQTTEETKQIDQPIPFQEISNKEKSPVIDEGVETNILEKVPSPAPNVESNHTQEFQSQTEPELPPNEDENLEAPMDLNETLEIPEDLEPPRVGINGFERMGRLILQAAFESGLEIQAINDPFIAANFMVYGLKYDVAHCNKAYHKEDMTVRQSPTGQLIVNGKSIHVFECRDSAKIPWEEAGVNYVIETSEALQSAIEAQRHLRSPFRGMKRPKSESITDQPKPHSVVYGGCHRVILASPTNDAPLYAVGVNDHKFGANERIRSHVSPAASAMLPILKLLENNFGLLSCSFTLLKSIRVGDSKSIKCPSLGPSSHSKAIKWDFTENLVPSGLNHVTEELVRVLPVLGGRVNGICVYVPTPDVSLLDLTIELKHGSDQIYRDVCLKLKEAAEGPFRRVLRYCMKQSDDNPASSVFASDTHSAVVDAKSGTQITRNVVKLVVWFDNDYGFANRIIDLVTNSHVLQQRESVTSS